MVSTQKNHRGLTVRDFITIFVIFALMVLLYSIFNALSVEGRNSVNPSSSVIFRTPEDINPEQMQRMLNWITQNFTELYRLSGAMTIAIAEGESVVVKLKSNDSGILIVKR